MQSLAFHKTILYSCLIVSMTVLTTGCEKFLEPDFKTQVTEDVVFANDANAQAAISGLYSNLSTTTAFNGEMTRLAAFSADELAYYTTVLSYDQFQKNQLLPDNSDVKNIWDNYYKAIYQCNTIIENSSTSTGMSEAVKTQLMGEAKFLRAFCHFYLVNCFGPVPLITATAKEKTADAPRNTVEEVYTQIKADLTDAMNTLPGDYAITGAKRIRANKWAAAAMLARVYCYTKDWANAEAMATAVLDNTSLYSLQTTANINNVFLKNGTESILEWDRTPLSATLEASIFLGWFNYFGYFDHTMLPTLINSFDSNDVRKTNWVKTGSTGSGPYKYKTSLGATENYLVLRVAEQYLIRAEARTQQSNISGAQADINVIRNRAGLDNDNTMTDKITAMAAIENERRHELFCEWGHRWFDLKRWPSLTAPATKTRADDVLGTLKTTWTSTAILYPIPQTARDANRNLTQNGGY
ncbi:SusD family protein [Chitinophaga sp. CF118]|uniref:RagB/SusD family nutrient uptake outer membrane protein n=1 Tax=Chitinophaga sp. CF118 TaxID=1884367 RepID=UPI0008EEDDDA|nr:RagB/SusD family nutrient uptake outer membrane protein [Chitinophaga sp. CF118]SFE50007.1 SusD family protein [Chitinophaga sp. CF118]